MSTDDRKGLQTRHIILDTSIYASQKMDLSSRSFEQLKKLVHDFGLVIHYDDMIAFECRRRIRTRVSEIAKAHRDYRVQVDNWRRAFSMRGLKEVDGINEEEMFREANLRFFSNLDLHFGAKRIEENVDLDTLLTRYEKMEPPFHTHGSKEFPDAIIVERAVKHAKGLNNKIYFISGDKKMRAAAEFHEALIPLSSLNDLFDLLLRDKEPKVVKEVEGYLDRDEFYDEVIEWINRHLSIKIMSGEVIYTGHAEVGGATEIEALAITDIGPFSVFSVDEKEITCVTPVNFDAQIEAEFGYVINRDTEDEDWAEASRTYEQNLSNSAYITFDRSDGSVASVVLIHKIHFDDPED